MTTTHSGERPDSASATNRAEPSAGEVVQSQPAPSAPQGHDGSPIASIEKLLQLGGAAAALLAVMGFPAVYLRYLELGIPAYLIPSDQVIRAGALPSLSLIIAYLWMVWVREKLGENTFVTVSNTIRNLTILTVLFLVLFILFVPKVFPLDIFTGVIIVVMIVFSPIIVSFSAVYSRPRMNTHTTAFLRFTESIRVAEYILKYIPESRINTYITSFSSRMTAYLSAFDNDPRMARIRVAEYVYYMIKHFAHVLMMLALYAILYYYVLYPAIPMSLGGGKSEKVTFLAAEDDFSTQLRGALGNPNCVDQNEDKTTLCSGVYLFYLGNDYVILTGSPDQAAPGVQISRDKLMAITW
jgi:hypothetical protein